MKAGEVGLGSHVAEAPDGNMAVCAYGVASNRYIVSNYVIDAFEEIKDEIFHKLGIMRETP